MKPAFLAICFRCGQRRITDATRPTAVCHPVFHGNVDAPPAPKRKHRTRWRDFIRTHMEVLAGTDFFTMEVFTLKGLVTYYVLFFIQLETRRVCLAGITPYLDQQWMEQQARNVTMKDWGFLAHSRYLLHPPAYCFVTWMLFALVVSVKPAVCPVNDPVSEPNVRAV